MDKHKQDVSYFISFCIEQYKNAKALEAKQVLDTFIEYEVIDYLSKHFEVLHTQNHHWILEEIDEFINKRKEKYK